MVQFFSISGYLMYRDPLAGVTASNLQTCAHTQYLASFEETPAVHHPSQLQLILIVQGCREFRCLVDSNSYQEAVAL